jgi:PRC-barrel domain
VTVRGETASTLLRAPVLTRGIRLGEVTSVLLDVEEPRILGLDVLCGDGANRFLPFSAVHRGTRGIEITSTLTLLDERELGFYRARSRSLASVPELADALIEADGTLVLPLSAYR